jgi:hypothetical protein
LRVALRAEKLSPHIVVNAGNFVPLTVEVQYGFRPN